jgi:predicted O-methyltransferase YrrM
VEIREGDALKTPGGRPARSIDLLLLDGAKALYPDILALVESRLRPGALIVADNADYSPEYLARVRAPQAAATCPRRSARTWNCRCASHVDPYESQESTWKQDENTSAATSGAGSWPGCCC